MTTIRKLIRDTCSSVITMQETKATQVGLIQFDGFFTYEQTRCGKEVGGVAISVKKI